MDRPLHQPQPQEAPARSYGHETEKCQTTLEGFYHPK